MRNVRWLAVVAIVALLGVYAALAWHAAAGESATFDEPLHVTASLAAGQLHDYRINPEHPVLWKRWIGLALPTTAGRIDQADPTWQELASNPLREWRVGIETLYRQSGNDADALLFHARAMMLIVAVVAGVAIAGGAWAIGGPIAGVIAAALFALDPTFLAFGPLVTNDVASSLAMICLALATYRVGQRVTWANLAAICAASTAVLTIKFSGILFPPIAASLLIGRAASPVPWPALGRTLQTRTRRVIASLVLCGIVAIVSLLGIWAVYSFRYGPSPDPSISLDLQAMLTRLQNSNIAAPAITPLLVFANGHHWLPQAYSFGLLPSFDNLHRYHSYLCGAISTSGWWRYFPLAICFKLPVGTLALGGIAIICGMIALARSEMRAAIRVMRWPLICLAAFPAIFFLLAMASPIDTGVRYALPAIAAAYLLAAIVLAQTLTRGSRALRITIFSLLCLTGVETLAASPHFIPFFNVFAGGSRGGLALLGDSNLDWGQDLPALAAWQRDNPDRTLYFAYFGCADPAHYGIRYYNLPGGYVMNPEQYLPNSPGVIAVSATILQGIYLSPEHEALYRELRGRQPLDVLGGSIYLFEFPLQPAAPAR